MQKVKRIISIVLASTMILGMVGCGNSEKAQAEPEQGQESEVVAETTELSWLNVGELPLVEEGTEKTLSIYTWMPTGSPDPEEMWMYDFISEAMNINVEVTKFTDENKAEILSLAFASGELPDIIIGGAYTDAAGGGFTATDLVNYGVIEKQIVNLAPYLNETYMPNYTKIFEEHPETKTNFVDSEGNVWSLGFITDGGDREQVQRVFINYDWLDELGLEPPKTLDEFTEFLRAAKAADSSRYPLGGSYSNQNTMIYILNALGYVTQSRTGLDIALRNGEVVLPVADREAYGAFLEIMNTYYEEGLIHPDYFTMDPTETKAMLSAGLNGFVSQAPFVCVDDYSAWWGPEALTSEYNDTSFWPANNGACSAGNAVVTSACEDVELACAFIDWFATVDNYTLSTSGPLTEQEDLLFDVGGRWYDVENNNAVHYVDFDEEGQTTWNSTADYLANEIRWWSYMTVGSQLAEDGSVDRKYGSPEVDMSSYEDPSDVREYLYENELKNKSFEYPLQYTVCEVITNDMFPAYAYLTAEESERAAELKVAITEYAKAEQAKFITGSRPLSEIDEYFNEIEELGALEYVQIYADYYASLQ